MNKKQIIYITLAVAILVGTILYFVFRTKPTNKTAISIEKEEEKHEEMSSASGIKEVHLNAAQYKATGLVLGGVEKKNLSEVINANGYTKLPPQNQAQVNVALPGIVKSIKVIEGQAVKAGQVLAVLQNLNYNNAQLTYNNMLLEREKLNSDLSLTEANIGYLQLEFARQKELSEENINAKKVFQKVSYDLNVEEVKIKAYKSQIAVLNQNIEFSGSINAPTINVIAPISGNITEVFVSIGSAAEVGKPLFTIIDNSQMHVDLLVYEKDLFKVKQGQTVRFILTNQNVTEITGTIFSIGKSFKNETKSVAVHADILNEKQSLIPGMYVNALIDVGTNTLDALPQEAIIKAEGREFIFILEEETEDEFHFQRIEVKTGTTQLGYIQVTPLQEMEAKNNIVINGAYYLQSHLTKSEGGEGHEH